MSVLRQGNWLGQQRIDVPHIRALESSITADFDVLAGLIMGGGIPQIIKGFNLLTTTAIGAPAISLQLVVAGGLVIHYGASEAGSIFWVPSTRANETLNTSNTNVTGSFTPSTTNYIGFDLIRSADSTTSDNIQFLDANSLLEISRTVPLGRTLNYKILISAIPFSANPNVCPIAKVATDANNNVTSVTDARRLLFRLGSGGDVPNTSFAYSWPQGRSEATATDVFSGGDKAPSSFSDWSDSIMTRLWEIGGGEYWYSATADKNVRMFGEGAVLGNGDYLAWSGTDLTWQNLVVVFNNSTGYYNEIVNRTTASPGLTDLAVGECLYVDLDRTQNRTRSGVTALQPVKAVLTNLGTPVIPGSRYIIAWRSANGNVIARDRPFLVNQAIAATTTSMGSVELSATPPVAATPVVATTNAAGQGMVTGLIRDANNVNGAGALTYTANAADTGIGHIINQATAMPTSGFLVSVQLQGAEKFSIDKNGGVYGSFFLNETAATPVSIEGQVANSGSNIAARVGNTTSLSGNTKIISFYSDAFSTEKASIDNTGSLLSPGIAAFAAGSLFAKGQAATSGSAIAVKIGNTTSLTTSGDLICAFYSDNVTTPKASIDKDGSLNANGLIAFNSNAPILIKGTATSSGTAIANKLGNNTSLTTSGDRIAVFYNDSFTTEKAYIDKDGNIASGGGTIFATGTSLFVRGTVTSSGTAVANKIGNGSSLTTAGDKIASFYSDSFTTEKLFIDKDGNVTNSAGSLIVSTSASNATVTIKGNRTGAGGGTDIVLTSAAGRSSGDTLVDFQNGGSSKATVDFSGVVHAPYQAIYSLMTADQGITQAFTNVNDGTHTLQFNAVANAAYVVEVNVIMSTTGTAGVNAQFTGPASPTVVQIGAQAILGTTVSGFGSAAFGSSFQLWGASSIATAATFRIYASIINGANAGSVTLQISTASAGTTTVKAGSWLRYIRVDGAGPTA